MLDVRRGAGGSAISCLYYILTQRLLVLRAPPHARAAVYVLKQA